MKILMVNKYLYVVGGAEKYMFSLGDELKKQGNEVQYFGIASSKNIAGNDWNITAKCFENSFAQKINFHSIVYSNSAKKSMDRLLDLYQPDLIHLNNINYQLTPSIIYSAKERKIPVVWTLHDSQLVCPSHRMYLEKKNKMCFSCLSGDFHFCIKNKCLGNSYIKSIIGFEEAKRYHKKDIIYNYVSFFICPSKALCELVSTFLGKKKTIVIQNFADINYPKSIQKEDYFLYFGRLSKEKGILTLLKALPAGVKLLIAGNGPLEAKILEAQKSNPLIHFIGFKTGKELSEIISKAICTIYPSEWFENCPLSIIESLYCKTPVIGSNIGGIPELIENKKNGLLFNPGDVNDLNDKIKEMKMNLSLRQKMYTNLANFSFPDVSSYCRDLMQVYLSLLKLKK